MGNDSEYTPQPSLIMESSWEVCNKVGGIYTVLSSRATTMVEQHGREKVFFIGPELTSEQPSFRHSTSHKDSELEEQLNAHCDLPIVVGNWAIMGDPRVILVDYKSLDKDKSSLYYELWETYGIRGDIGYGDYDDSVLFAIASAKVMIALSQIIGGDKNLSIFNEWTTGAGLLYLKHNAPAIRSIFITHATTVGRSIAGNGKPLYSELNNYNGDQMADELGVVCKHQVEKAAAHQADLFATVSEVTAREAEQLLEIRPQAILYNGFEHYVVPSTLKLKSEKASGQSALKHLAETLYGVTLSGDPLFIATSGRCEYRNKGIDLFIDALRRISESNYERDIVALILVPSWVKASREELKSVLETGEDTALAMPTPYITHELFDGFGNQILHHLHSLAHDWGHGVYPIFIPAYLDGNDGILNIPYYQLLPSIDLSIFPSYYEPWGYTPLESLSFGVPSITTDRAGFGVWAMENAEKNCLAHGIKVLHRDDYNFEDVSTEIAHKVTRFATFPDTARIESSNKARELAKAADWQCFYDRYLSAYQKALNSDRN